MLAEAERVYQELLAAMQTIVVEDLTDPHRFPGMPVEFQPWEIIASNTYEHYQQHMPDVRAWKEAPSTSAG